MKPISIADKLKLISEPWQPRNIAGLNDYRIKLARIEGEFIWHSHAETDELFLVLEGEFEMHYRDSIQTIAAGELVVVPKGVEHKPIASRPCAIMLIEPDGVVNTGDEDSERTAPADLWI